MITTLKIWFFRAMAWYSGSRSCSAGNLAFAYGELADAQRRAGDNRSAARTDRLRAAECRERDTWAGDVRFWQAKASELRAGRDPLDAHHPPARKAPEEGPP
jgi:hypothetical protein